MPPVKIADLTTTELGPEQMRNLRGGTSQPTAVPSEPGFCATPPSPYPWFDASQFPWNGQMPEMPEMPGLPGGELSGPGPFPID